MDGSFVTKTRRSTFLLVLVSAYTLVAPLSVFAVFPPVETTTGGNTIQGTPPDPFNQGTNTLLGIPEEPEIDNPPTAKTPEPSTIVMGMVGLACLGYRQIRRRAAA